MKSNKYIITYLEKKLQQITRPFVIQILLCLIFFFLVFFLENFPKFFHLKNVEGRED